MTTEDFNSAEWKRGLQCEVELDDGTTFKGEVIGVDFSTNVLRIRPQGKRFSSEYYYYSQVTLKGQERGRCGRSVRGRG